MTLFYGWIVFLSTPVLLSRMMVSAYPLCRDEGLFHSWIPPAPLPYAMPSAASQTEIGYSLFLNVLILPHSSIISYLIF